MPRISEQVVQQIVTYIHTHRLKEGEKLPTERHLSERLETSRASVREGLRVLEILGFIRSKQGHGTFVAKVPPFSIPKQIVNEPVLAEERFFYFEIAMMVAEKIVALVKEKNERIAPLFNDDWSSFSSFIRSLGEKLKNPYYLALWEETCAFLHKQRFFEQEPELLKRTIVQFRKRKGLVMTQGEDSLIEIEKE